MHFWRRFRAFEQRILEGAHSPLGTVTDYFFRFEFQDRNSVHVHGIVSVKPLPNINAPSVADEGVYCGPISKERKREI